MGSQDHRVHREATATFWHTFIMMEKIAQSGDSGGARPPLFTISTISYKVVVYAPAERAYTLSLFLLYPYRYSVAKTRENRERHTLEYM
jgi:hypothetical protein